MILLDTNILVRLTNEADVDYKITHAAIAGCWRKGRRLFVSDQAMQEFWVVATRSVQKNGLGMEPPRVDRFMSHYLRSFERLADKPSLFDTWRQFVNGYSVAGMKAYDARLAAFVRTYDLPGFMTFNLVDFRQFPIVLVDPRDPTTW